MAPSRRHSNGRSPLVNQQRQITSFFSKSISSSPSPSPILSKSNSKQKLNPNSIPDPNPSPSPSPTTPSPRNPKPNKPLLLIGGASSPSPLTPPPSLYGQDVVGRRIKVYWPLDKAWYEGIVKSFDELTSKHLVQYDDDEEESLDLSKEKIEWLQDSAVKKLKRLRRGLSAFRQMVVEDDEVEESQSCGGDDSSDEDWGKNEEAVEDAVDGEEDMELEDEEDEEEVAERSKGKPRGKVEPRKRKLGATEKLGPAKKSKSGTEVGMGGFKVSSLESTSNSEST